MPETPRILFVDDEPLLHDVVTRLLGRRGMEVTSCNSAVQAVDVLAEHAFDLVLTDFKMPDMDGLELLAHVRQHYPDLRVIMITAHASVQHAVRAMTVGAIDYIPKPFATEELVERILKSLASPPVAAPPPGASKTKSGKGKGKGKGKKVEYVGTHQSIQRLKAMLPLVAQNDAPVFIRGESGTGKEILSRIIHQTSARAKGAYVTLNCANLPSELVESHLFGHRKGAFTGAVADMTGAFEEASGGTLLLDEVTEVAPAVQAKLLRALQEKEIQRVGETKVTPVDVRVIATSNRDLREAMAEKSFREDLYHRLAVFPLSVPPLRERASDIPLLADHFVEKYTGLYGLPDKTITPGLMAYLQRQPWPGNVRQLENLVQRGVLISADRTEIELADVQNDFFDDAGFAAKEGSGSHNGGTFPAGITKIEEMERVMILQALKDTDQNQQLAANRLGISARTIRNKLKKYRDEGTLPDED